MTGIPYTGPKANESYEIYIFLQNPLPYTPPTADVMLLKWSALQGPTALATVEDHVCTDCVSFLKMKDTEPNYKIFLAQALSKDTDTQSWEIDAWGSPADRCYSSLMTNNCEVMTAKVKRKWTSFIEKEDLALSNKAVAIKLVTKDMDGKVAAYGFKTVNFGKSPGTTGALSFGMSASLMILAQASFLSLF